MQKIIGSIYDFPQLYDVLFSDLCRSEVMFLQSIFERFCRKNSSFSLLEPASGSGRLIYQLARRGFDISGIDLNPLAVDYCNRRLRRHGLCESAHVGNMIAFSLADLRRKRKFDAAFNFVSSFLHLIAEADAVRHLQTIAQVLKPNGLYLLGLHLKPADKQHCLSERWTRQHGRLRLKSSLQSLSQDLEKRIETIEMRLEAQTPTKHYQVIDHFPLRIYSADQFSQLLKSAACFDVLETYSFDYDALCPMPVTAETEDVVYVLKTRRC